MAQSSQISAPRLQALRNALKFWQIRTRTKTLYVDVPVEAPAEVNYAR